MRFRVKGVRFGVQSSGFRIEGLWVRCRVQGVRFGVEVLGSQRFGFRACRLRIRRRGRCMESGTWVECV